MFLYSCLSYPAWKSHLLCAVLYFHLWPVRLYDYFSTLSHKQHDFRSKCFEQKYDFWFSLQRLSETLLILRRIQRVLSYIYVVCHVSYTFFLSDFNETWILSTDFRKILKYKILWKSVPWELSWLMRTERRTDRQGEANSHFWAIVWTRLKIGQFCSD